MDKRTEKNLLTLDPKAQPAFRRFIEAAQAEATKHGLEYVAISGNRTWEQQDALYAQGRTKPGRMVTNAAGGQSNHNFGIALDFGAFRGGKYLDDGEPKIAWDFHKLAATFAKAEGLEWGGDWTTFKDAPHFEVKTGLTMRQKRERWAAKGSVL